MKIDPKAFVKKDIGKLVSLVTDNADKIGMALTLLSLGVGSIKAKNDHETMKKQIMNEMGDELMEEAMARTMKKLSESNKGS